MCIRDRYGLQLCWQSRLLKGLFAIAWVAALGLIGFYFLIGQLLTPDSSLVQLITENPVSYTHLRAHETVLDLVCRLLLEKKTQITIHPLYPSFNQQ